MKSFRNLPLCGLMVAFCLTLFGTTAASADWSHDPLLNTSLNNDIGYNSGFSSIPDSYGGAITFWRDSQAGYQLMAQRIDSSGQLLWGNYGIPLLTDTTADADPQMVPDGTGGLFLAWSNANATGRLVTVQHFDANGLATWAEGGVSVTYYNYSDTQQTEPRLDTDGAGGIIVGWISERLGEMFVGAQHFSSTGSRLWGTGGKTVSDNLLTKAGLALDAGDTPGEVFLAWQEWITDNDWDLFTQRLAADGSQLWTEASDRQLAQRAGAQTDVQIVHHGSNNMIALWIDSSSGHSEVYYQFKWSTGISGVISDYGSQLTGFYDYQEKPHLVSDEAGNAFAVYLDQNQTSGGRIAAQYWPAAEYTYWDRTGKTLFEDTRLNMGEAALVADNQGGFFATWPDYQYANSYSVHHFNFFGEPTWPEGRSAFTMTELAYQTEMTLVSNAQGGVIAGWLGTKTDAYRAYPTCQRIDSFGFMGENSFAVTTAADRPNDQGGEVTLSWNASPLDQLQDQAIASYSMWIRPTAKTGALVAANLPAGTNLTNDQLADLLQMPIAGITALKSDDWAYAGQVPAMLSTDYAGLCPTYGDSSDVGISYTEFKVVAHHQDSGVFWECSNNLAGYSVDNLAPGAPLNLTGLDNTGRVNLSWLASGYLDEDLSAYRVYRGTVSGFALDGSNLLATTATTDYEDESSAGLVYYRVTAVDAHGNESAPSAEVMLELATSTVTGVPTAFTHRGNFPNPFNPMTNIAFDLPRAAQVRVTVYDTSGHLVATVTSESMAAGPHQVRWNGQDERGQSVASGVYFSRVEAGELSATRSMTLVR